MPEACREIPDCLAADTARFVSKEGVLRVLVYTFLIGIWTKRDAIASIVLQETRRGLFLVACARCNRLRFSRSVT